MTTIETTVRDNFCRILERPLQEAAEIDLDRDLFGHYGVTSLNMVLLMTSLCEDTGADLTHFTERDLAAMKTLRHVVEAFERACPGRT